MDGVINGMIVTDYTNPSRGLLVASSLGSQKFTEALDSYSQIFTDILVSKNNTKNGIDICWENGNIYYCNYDTGLVKKIAYDGTEIAELQLVNPVVLSIIQYSSEMQVNVTYPPQEEQGCWIADKGTGKIIKTDSDLNILYELSGLTNPVAIKNTSTGGCCYADDGVAVVKVLSSNGTVLATKNYSDFTPNAIDKVLEIATTTRLGRELWILARDSSDKLEKIYGLDINLVAWVTNPISPTGDTDIFSSSSYEEEMHVGGIDVDKQSGNDQFLYITGGNSEKAWVLKYDSAAANKIAEQTYHNITYPYIIKVVQAFSSSSLYILEDTSKWDEFGYGSSSSSSSSSSTSYIENWSSSSTSYFVNWSSSSSSSSSI
jgi:hypothetical protein